MKYFYTSLFILLLFAQSIGSNYSLEEARELGDFLKKYNPTFDRCRPLIRAQGNSFIKVPDNESLPYLAGDTLNATLACMLSGYKKVALFAFDPMSNDHPYKPLVFTQNFKRIIQKNNLFYIRATNQDEVYIWYVSTNRVDALLLLKIYLEPPIEKLGYSDYLVGKLLGYTDTDTRARYLSDRKPKAIDRYECDKQAALDWIKKNKDTIEKWLKDNMQKYSIQYGQVGI